MSLDAGDKAYRFKNVLVHTLVPKRLEVIPVERRLAGSRAANKEDNIEIVLFSEDDGSYTR